ncbi:MAG: 5-oxoprolinase/urea amidolyase family protein [Streptosporangiaceae bacterium]
MISFRPAGDAGLLVTIDDSPARLATAIGAAGLPDLTDIVPGARAVLVRFAPGAWLPGALADAISGLDLPADDPADEPAVRIPVVYDGQDLAGVARLAGLTVSEVAAVHSGGDYRVGWLGFCPGFGYLTGLDPRLDVPRLATPRVAVPAGSVAIAGGLTGVYPAASPGGWRLLGRTTARMWDTSRDPPALLAPGRRVRFEAVRPVPADTRPAEARADGARTDGVRSPGAGSAPRPALAPGQPGQPSLEIVRTGPLATVQDLGRPGYGAVGVPQSGAADQVSLAAANRLAGNEDAAAAIELTLGRAVVRCPEPVRLATAGAPAAVRLTAGHGEVSDVVFGTAFDVLAGGVVSVGAAETGLRTYLAVAGGVVTPPVLGSRSADLLSGIGGPLRPGDVLPVGRPGPARTGPAAPGRVRLPERGTPAVLRVRPGPRLDWFGPDALATLCGAVYTVGPASNRTGLRLAGPPLPRAGDAELASEGMVTGSLQVPHDGQPILLLADHPTVGGYPVIAVLASADIGLAAQLRPGEAIRFGTAL